MMNIFAFEERLYRYTRLLDLNFLRHLDDVEMDEFRFLFRYFHDQKFRNIEDNKEERIMIDTINYKDKCILYLNHENKGDKDLLNDLIAGNVAIEQALKTGDVLVLASFKGAYMSQAAMDYLKSEESIRINSKVKKTAVFGISGVQKILLKVFVAINKKDVGVFENEDAAKEYLVS